MLSTSVDLQGLDFSDSRDSNRVPKTPLKNYGLNKP